MALLTVYRGTSRGRWVVWYVSLNLNGSTSACLYVRFNNPDKSYVVSDCDASITTVDIASDLKFMSKVTRISRVQWYYDRYDFGNLLKLLASDIFFLQVTRSAYVCFTFSCVISRLSLVGFCYVFGIQIFFFKVVRSHSVSLSSFSSIQNLWSSSLLQNEW